MSYYMIRARFDTPKNEEDILGLYVMEGEDQYCLIQNPFFSTEFSSKRAAKQWIANNVVYPEYYEPVKPEPHIEAFLRYTNSPGIKSTLPLLSKSSLNRKYDKKKHSTTDVIQWWWEFKSELNRDLLVRNDVYSSWPSLSDLTKHICEVEAYYDQEDDSKLQVTFRLFVRKGESSFRDFEREVKHLLKNHRPTYKTDKGEVIFPIMDHYLSEGGNSVTLVCEGRNKWRIDGRYNNVGIVEGPLRKVYDYLLTERYY